jgi:flagellar basal body-associated protein FliL
MASQQKQIFFIILLALILVVGGALTLYYWFNNDATAAKHERVLKNIEKSNQDFLNILEQNRAALEALSATSTATTTQVANPPKQQTNQATSSDPLAPTL